MPDEERRRAPRVHLELPVTLVGASSTTTLLAIDLSKRGMFIKTDAPAPVRRLVRLRIPYSEDGEELQALAMVVHRVSVPEARNGNAPPGMGVHLYGLGPVARNRWNAWVEHLAEKYGTDEEGDKPGGPPPLHPLGKDKKPVDAVRRAHERFSVRWTVRLIGSDYEETYTRDISAGGAQLEVNQKYEAGDVLDMILIHPESHEGFDVSARVIRYIPCDEGPAAIGVAYLDIDDERREELDQFIRSGIPKEMSDVLEILEVNDPMLE